MPVKSTTNNRILPSNARAIDVAKRTIDQIIPIQNRRYHAAFQVQGYGGVLYSRLESGIRCACKSMVHTISSRINEDGNADPGVINSVLTGQEFGVRRYGSRQADNPGWQLADDGSFVIDIQTQRPTQSSFDRQVNTRSGNANTTIFGSQFDRMSNDASDPASSTIISDAEGVNGPTDGVYSLDDLASNFDRTLHAHSDISCPICLGTGYTGGYSVYNGWRRVFTAFEDAVKNSADTYIDTVEDIPTSHGISSEWSVVLPFGAIGVDRCCVFNGLQPCTSVQIYIDDVRLTSEHHLLSFCNGRMHTVKIAFPEETTWTHFEVQVNVSRDEALFELPKTTKSSIMSLLETTDPFQVILSPMIPRLRALDVICESTLGKTLHVKGVTNFNDKKASILGWEAEVRVTQPHELISKLPKRRTIIQARRPAMVTDNITGNKRT
jgi:hypothetical protein